MSTSNVFGGAVMAALVFSSTAALADEAAPPPPPVSTTTTTQATVDPVPPLTPPPARNYETATLSQKIRPNRPLLIGGGVLLIGAYVPTAVLTATNDKDRTLYIPVAGPWLSLAGNNHVGTTETALTVGSGIVQDAGALLMLASLVVPERIPAATIKAAGMKVNVLPTSYGAGSAGVGAVGTF